ncbi:hypothetical protein [Protofrankia symbiont of Coriaria ruscifolia]|uniref:hypothetical protein n=1 Tax=Protofrankia symbiont of Coriaria ruscifolia TaxID=1306542 RepID=UPI001A94731B|nr:hypothetical protein [Protofrankia symbiont of Coriaria ruscifolia]
MDAPRTELLIALPHGSSVTHAVFSGDWVVTGAADGSITRWKRDSRGSHQVLTAHARLVEVISTTL